MWSAFLVNAIYGYIKLVSFGVRAVDKEEIIEKSRNDFSENFLSPLICAGHQYILELALEEIGWSSCFNIWHRCYWYSTNSKSWMDKKNVSANKSNWMLGWTKGYSTKEKVR